MIQIQSITFGYKSNQTLFSELSLDIPRGSIVGLLGRNGEGKSTLMKLIAGQLHARAGMVTTLGSNARERQVEMLRQLYMLPEDIILPRMTIREYFGIISPLYPTYDAEMADQIIQEFDLQWEMNLGTISLGQKKKAAIALALSLRTPLLLLDEPTNGLDIPSKSTFRRLLAGYISEEQTVIISTHQVRDLEQLIDRIILLDHNRIVCNESVVRLTELFTFGKVTADNAARAIYREGGVMGEYGVWATEADREGYEFSMELFFNAMVSEPRAMQRILLIGEEPTHSYQPTNQN